jgi:hypothetical protein
LSRIGRVIWTATVICKNQREVRFLLFTIPYTAPLDTNKNRGLKVDGNEKLGGLRFLQLLGIGLGLWRSMSIFILNIPFANAKLISVSAHSSEMNRRLVCN